MPDARSWPPRWVRAAARILPVRYRSEIVADLLDERSRMIASGRASRATASVWLMAHLVRSAVASRRIGRPDQGWRSIAATLTQGGGSPLRESLQAIRSLRRAPWYAVTVIAVTALGMALASTVFAVVDGVLFKPLPYPNPGELYAMSARVESDRGPSDRIVEMVSPNDVTAWAAATDVAVTSIGYTNVQLPDASIVFVAAVDRRFFDVFGVRLLLGGFRDDDFIGEQPVMPVIISHRVWQDHFDRDPGVIGRTVPPLSAFSQPYRIVGIMAADGFVPPVPRNSLGARRQNRIEVLRPPFTEALRDRSNVAFARVSSARRAQFVASLNRVDLVPLRDYVSSHERPVFTMAFGTVMCLVCLVMLNACALAAARAQERIRDFSLRRALGARTRDLLRHAVAEQALLSTLGTIAGLVAAPMLLALVLDRLPEGTTLIKEARVDWRVVGFAALLSSAAALVVALLSVRVAVRQSSATPILADVHGAPPTYARASRLLVAGQTAMAFGLVLGGVLFGASLARLWNEDLGFQPGNAAILELVYPVQDIRQYSLRAFRARALDLARRLRSTPGVRQAGVLDALMMQNVEHQDRAFSAPAGAIEGAPVPAAVSVGSGFFQAAGIDPVVGRLPSDTELDAGTPVLAVSESVARAYWPGRQAIGQTLRARNRVDCVVIGIVRDVRLVALDVPSTGVIFSPWSLNIPPSEYAPKLLISLEGDAARTLASVQATALKADPGVRLAKVQLLEDAMADTIRARRLGALAAEAFGAVALVFVAVGLIGLVAMTSSRRTREMGIRLALGAARADIVRLLLREQLGAVLAGLMIGGVFAAWAAPIAGAHVYGIGVYDPVVWVVAVAFIAATAAFSAWLPAYRAGRIDPVASLRVG